MHNTDSGSEAGMTKMPGAYHWVFLSSSLGKSASPFWTFVPDLSPPHFFASSKLLESSALRSFSSYCHAELVSASSLCFVFMAKRNQRCRPRILKQVQDDTKNHSSSLGKRASPFLTGFPGVNEPSVVLNCE